MTPVWLRMHDSNMSKPALSISASEATSAARTIPDCNACLPASWMADCSPRTACCRLPDANPGVQTRLPCRASSAPRSLNGTRSTSMPLWSSSPAARGIPSGRKTWPDFRRWCSTHQFTGTVCVFGSGFSSSGPAPSPSESDRCSGRCRVKEPRESAKIMLLINPAFRSTDPQHPK